MSIPTPHPTSQSSPHFDHESGVARMMRPPLELSGRVVLLATDGSAGAVAAARVAHALASHHGAVVKVVSVMDARPAAALPALGATLELGDALGGAELHRAQERAVQAELSGTLGATVDWPVRVMLGTPSSAIVQEANRVGAALVVMGLRRHGRLDHLVRDETALNVMRIAACPVLGVVAEARDLPRRILAGVDFSEGSLVAMRAGHAVAGKDALLVLAYVDAMSGYLADEGEATIHDLGVRAGFGKLTRELGDDGLTFDHVVLHGAPTQGPAQALLEYADDVGCDLITAGSVQHSRLDRWMVGSVSAELVRNGRRSVLIMPPRDRA
jgi:nucleotide-binding universal stress UspA family protein